MAIFTPRRLKVRLPTDYSFALMARLYPRVGAFKVLKTVEAIEHIPSVLAFCVAIVLFAEAGLGITGAERGFINAYRLHATQTGETINLKSLLCYRYAVVRPTRASDAAAGLRILHYGYHRNAGFSLEVSEEELKRENWEPVLMDLALKWPEVVARFT